MSPIHNSLYHSITYHYGPFFAVFSQINIPVLPAGLQIMADQGFQNGYPVLVLPRFNQPVIPVNMRRYTSVIQKYEQLFCRVYDTFESQYFRTFRSRRTMIERCFGILKNSYTSTGKRRFRSRRWNGPLIFAI